MPGNNRSSIDAFIDKGFPDRKTFCAQFLYSPEFNVNTLKSLTKSKKNRSKYDLAVSLAASLDDKRIDPDKILLAFVQQPRKWLSIKLGRFEQYPTSEPASRLLTEFGEEGWYGPIKDLETYRRWYIRTFKVPFFEQIYQAEGAAEGEIAGQAKSVASYQIRWTVLAEIGENYAALSWNGFRHNNLKPGLYDPQIESLMQFPYWCHIPVFLMNLQHNREPIGSIQFFIKLFYNTFGTSILLNLSMFGDI